MISRTDTNEVFQDSVLVSSEVVIVDITAESIEFDLHDRARTALTANAAFLALTTPTTAQTLAQVKRLTRECSALIRLLIGADLLAENTDT